MDSKEKKSEKASKQNKVAMNSEDNNIYIYCISSFNKKINNIFSLIAKNNEVLSIKVLLKTHMKCYEDYDFIVNEICISKKIKNLNLYLNYKNIFYELNTISIKSSQQKLILLDDLIVVQNSINKLANELALIKSVYVLQYINICDKYNIYLKCFEEQKNKDELKVLLALKILSNLKKNSEIKFSVLISLFNIIFGNKLITKFLDTYPKLDIVCDEINKEKEEFNNKILKPYENDNEKLFEKNLKFFGSSEKLNIMNKVNSLSEEKYKFLLENFIVLYKLLYEDPKNIEPRKLINVREIFFNLIENKNDIFKILNFMLQKYDIIYLLLSKENEKRYSIKPIFNDFLPEINCERFTELYKSFLAKKSEKYIFDFSKVFNYFIDELKDLEQLISLKELYKKELSIFSNEYFEKNIIKKIHKIGMVEIMSGKKNNSQILNFLRNNDVYCKKGNKIKEYKDFRILKNLKVELMDDNFFEMFNEYKIYSFFEENYEKYLEMFTSIDKMKYFGLFFKLLPPEKYQKQTALYVFNWLMENINTYKSSDCPNFKTEVETFYSILNNLSKFLLPKLIEKLKEFLGEDCIGLFIFLLNSFSQNLGQNESELMISYIIFEKQNKEIEKKIKLNNIYSFLEKVKPSKLIAKTFLNIIGELSITQDDFLSETNKKFDLLDNILKRKEYSLLEEPENKNCQYWLYTIEESKKIYENLKNLNFEFINLQIAFNIIKEKIFVRRIALITKSLNREDYESFSLSKVKELKDILKCWGNNTKTIEKIVNVYKFINKPENIIQELYDYNVKIYHSTLQYLNSNNSSKEFFEKSKNIEKINKIHKLRECKIFMNIFYDTKKKISSMNSNDFIDIVLERFDKIKNIFINDKKSFENELTKNDEAKFLINIEYKNDNDLEKQIDWLLNYFKINDFELKFELIDRLKLMVKKKSLSLMSSGLVKLFDIYRDILNLTNSSDISLYETMLNYQSFLSSNEEINFEKIQEINNNIENIFELDESKSKIFFKLLIEINQYPDSMKFIKDKKLKEVENIVEFFLESDVPNLTEKDINNFMSLVKFLEEIVSNVKEENNIFKRFLNKIFAKMIEDKELQESFFNYIEKYEHIQTLFNNKLKSSEGRLIIIEKMLNYSYFSILKEDSFFSSSTYTMEAFYIEQNLNNNINNGNEQVNEKKKEEYIDNQYRSIIYQELEQLFQRIYISNIPKKYEKDVDLFINFFKNAKKLLDLFEKLYQKGYPEDFDDTFIEIKNKIVICTYKKKNYNIESLIVHFQAIYNKVNSSLNKCYGFNEILRFFYGRQLFYIYNNKKY